MNHLLSDPPTSSRLRWPALLGFLVAGVAMFAAFVMRRRRVAEPEVSVFADSLPAEVPVKPVAVAQTAVQLPPPIRFEQGPFSARRWFAFVLFLLSLVVGFMALQDTDPSVSIALFVFLLVGSVLLAIWRTPQVVYQVTRTVTTFVRTTAQVTARGAVMPFTIIRHFVRPMRVTLSSTTAILSALVMLVAAGILWYMADTRGSTVNGLILFIVGTLLMGMAISLKPNLSRMAQLERVIEKSTVQSGWFLTGAGIFTLAVLAEINGNLLHIPFLFSVDTTVQFIMLILGIALLVMGLGGFRVGPYLSLAILNFLRPLPVKPAAVVPVAERVLDPVVAPPDVLPPVRAANWQTYVVGFFSALTTRYAVLFLTLLGLVMRFWELNHVYRFFIDELLNIDAVFYILGNRDIPLLAPFSSIAAFPYIFPYWQTGGVLLFGHTYMGVRVASAVLGALAVPGLYLLAKTLFDNKTAFVAALLLATFPPHLQFSRIGINEMGGPLFATFAFLFLARGMLHNRRRDYALGGALLGLTHYFDEGSRLLFTPMVVMWMIGLLVLWRPRGRLRNYLVALVALIVIALPIYYTLNGLKRPVAARMVDNNSGLSGSYWNELFTSSNFQRRLTEHLNEHLIPAFSVYFNQGDTTLFYKGETAMLLVYAAPFFLLGLAYLLWNWRSPGALLFLLWVFCVSFGNSILVSSASYPRFAIVFPALALVMAVGICYGVPLLLQAKKVRRWQMPVIVILAIGLAFFQANYYFNEHIPTFSRQFRDNWPHPDAEDGILRALDAPLGAELHFISPVPPDGNYNKGAASFLLDGTVFVDTLTPEQLTTAYFIKLSCGVEHIFYLEGNDFASLRRIQHYFTLGAPQWSAYDDVPPRKQFVMFRAHDFPTKTSVYSRRCS